MSRASDAGSEARPRHKKKKKKKTKKAPADRLHSAFAKREEALRPCGKYGSNRAMPCMLRSGRCELYETEIEHAKKIREGHARSGSWVTGCRFDLS
jgi:hypothetical protein